MKDCQYFIFVLGFLQKKGGGLMSPKKLEILEMGNPILRQKAKKVGKVVGGKLQITDEIQTLIDNMLYTCAQVDGVGLAAPQVGVSVRVFIMASKPNDRYPNAPSMEPTAIINPVVVETGSGIDLSEDWEGCLSVPGLYGLVFRYDQIGVRFRDREGLLQHRAFDGFLARIFQHEYDHLEGALFVDKVTDANEPGHWTETRNRVISYGLDSGYWPRELITRKEYLRLVAAKK